MRRKLFLVALGITLAAIFVLGIKIKEAKGEDRPALDFTLPGLDGSQINLRDFSGRPVVLFLWTTWCPYCRKELKVLSGMKDKLAKDKVVLLVINVGESRSRVANFLKNNPLKFTVLLDEDESVSELFDIWGIPTYVLIDKNGNIRFKHNYFPKETYRELILQ